MDVEVLIQLAGSGNVRTIEDEWLTALTEEQTSLEAWLERVKVLDALVKADRAGEAGELAWTALETLRERHPAVDLIPLAGAIMMTLDGSDDVRSLVGDLYKSAYSDRPNIECLIQEAGLGGGRTPRRALRTLDVCLAVTAESYLVGRHDDAAARVEAIDPESWRITVATARGSRELDPTSLADKYAPADADDYRVLSHFHPDRLTEILEKNPVPVIKRIVRSHRDRMTSDALEAFLTERLIAPDQWTRWWSRARTQLKRAPDMRIEGRSPYVIVYDPEADTLEDEVRRRFDRTHDSAGSLKVIQHYLRECRVRKDEPAAELLRHMVDKLAARARRQQKIGNKLALETLLTAGRVRQATGDQEAIGQAVELLAAAEVPNDYILAIEVVDLWPDACACLERAYPSDARNRLAQLLPVAPTPACDAIATRMLELGYRPEDMDELVQEVVAEPADHYGTLLWLWSGPTHKEVTRSVTFTALLHRILAMLADLKRSDRIDRGVKKDIRAGVRVALAARKYARFKNCLETMDLGTGTTLYTQIRRLDELGRAVQEDLLKLTGDRFPEIFARPKLAPWEEENVLYVTARGLAAKEAEIHELVNVKMKENAKAIGAAAEHGDLSENSEYKFALEERDLLRARLAQMNAQMEMAQVLEPDQVSADRVGIGTRVMLRHAESGAPREMVILSAWEADAEKQIINYKAPLAQAILGARQGDTIELLLTDAPGAYIVESMSNALKE